MDGYTQRRGDFLLREEGGALSTLTLTCGEILIWRVPVPHWRWQVEIEGTQLVCRDRGVELWRVGLPATFDLAHWQAWGAGADEARDERTRAWRARQGGVS